MSKEKDTKKSKAAADESTAPKSAEEQKKERLAKLRSFETAMEKTYGLEIIQNGSDKKAHEVDTISTGSVSLDVALGVGGLPKGRVVEIYGPEASGKTTLTLQVIAQAQRAGGICGFVDVEQALDVSYAKQVGVKFDETLTISSPEYGEQALTIAKEMAQSGAFDVIIIDSVAALVPKKELEGEIGDAQMGAMARMMGQALRVLTPVAKQNNVLIIFINQIREKIGVMYGSPETTTGGNALKFYASVRLRVRKASGPALVTKIDGVEREGYKMVVKLVKNKLNSPQEDVELPIVYGHGVDSAFDLFGAAKALEVIKVTGRTHTVGEGENEIVIGKSNDDALETVRTNKDVYKRVEKMVRAKLTK